MSKPEVAQPHAKQWTQVEAYLGGLTQRRLARRARRMPARSEPESPRLLLSTIPFAVLLAVMAILVVVFAVAAWPGSQPDFQPPVAGHELGTAPPGWFEHARKDMR